MNFFNSVFSDQPDSPSHNSDQSDSSPHHSDQPDPDHDTPTASTAWSFGGLIQTLASKSESVIENYRRDLEEFGSGLRIETSVIREAASRAVKDLPASLDVGASVAQESLETVGQAIDDIGSSVWKSTAQIISHGRDSLLSPDSDSDSYDSINNRLRSSGSVGQGLDLKRYSRFDSLVRALQSDVNTYLEEPEDLGNFNEWKLGFEMDNKEEEIESLIKENDAVEEIYEKVVPRKIDDERFWSRYFYKLHKLKQAEDARATLVKRAISGNEEEDLSWDFDDDDDNDDGYVPNVPKGSSSSTSGVSELKEDNSAEVVAAADGAIANVEIIKDLKIENDEKGVVVSHESVSADGGDDKLEGVNHNDNVESNVPVTVTLSDQDDKLDVKNEGLETKTDSDISVVSSQPSMPEEEDISWDEIEDVESNDESKGDVAGGSESRIDLRKRLSSATADQDEDLSWDIEDDDEAVKS
ncbi:bsd domain-containing protein 1-like [Trifolium pratense]|uniref:Bsd domain-containing protein 1-like n=2 Tax=Trifolium TaxID=3898 RepID=A0A2K3NVZ1_TRIPR|nr:bsd domain-containing protein 1-like [Trifolium pratense]